MNHKDFRIGNYFYLSGNKYLCTDVGRRTIAALRADYADITTSKNGKSKTKKHKLTRKDIGGPPYWLAELVVDEYAMEVCYKTRTEPEWHTKPAKQSIAGRKRD
ncbi:MAG: hypothetical protein PHG23_02830 [Candidatus Pacebacteria bacterium]|nr:hypothetical protein [Candidatus Paceibacterota bacterium]